MFTEPFIGEKSLPNKKGNIEVICGSMFSGKTEELIRRLNRAIIARQKVEIFKPKMDDRYHERDVVSHNYTSIKSTPVLFAEEIIQLAGKCDVVGIDEVQFFDHKIINVATVLAKAGKRVILAGFDMDFEGNPFEPVPQLLAIAEFVTKLNAICMVCGDLSSYSFRLSDAEERVVLGESGNYEARCRQCFLKNKR